MTTTPRPSLAYISVGSNIDPQTHLPAAMSLLLETDDVEVLAASQVYRTPAIDRPDQDDYRNTVWAIRTHKAPHDVQAALRDIEGALGRERTGDKYAARTLDLDMVIYGSRIIDDGELTLPHPDLSRPWVAAGVLELDPAITHSQCLQQLPWLAECSKPTCDVDKTLTRTLRDLLNRK